jgi:hypothetical protein
MLGEVAVADWQVVNAHLGRARSLVALGRIEAARGALAEADEMAPGIAEEMGKELWG